MQVYRTLVECLKTYVTRAAEATGEEAKTHRQSFKALEYIFKLIVRSRLLHIQMGVEPGNAQVFKNELRQLFISFNNLMKVPGQGDVLAAQNILLQNFAFVFLDLGRLFSLGELGVFAKDFILSIAKEHSGGPKLKFLQTLVKGQLFSAKESRAQMMAAVTVVLHSHIDRREDLDVCMDILQDVLNVLYADPEHERKRGDPGVYDDLLNVSCALVL